jgi:hypothetical protein
MKCNCGNYLSNVACPNTMEGEIKGIYEYKSRNVWECAQCGRLWIDIDDPAVKGCHISKSYLPEDGKPEEIFNIGTSRQLLDYLENFWKFHHEDLKQLGIIKDKEPILNKCIQEYQNNIHELQERIEELEEYIKGL